MIDGKKAIYYFKLTVYALNIYLYLPACLPMLEEEKKEMFRKQQHRLGGDTNKKQAASLKVSFVARKNWMPIFGANLLHYFDSSRNRTLHPLKVDYGWLADCNNKSQSATVNKTTIN